MRTTHPINLYPKTRAVLL